MPDRRMVRAAARLNDRLKLNDGASVSYVRGDTTLALTVIVGRTAFRSNIQGGAAVEWGDRDYIMTAADLAELIEPQEGDRLTETINGVAMTFEIMRPDTGEPAVRWSDPQKVAYRLHVKQVA